MVIPDKNRKDFTYEKICLFIIIAVIITSLGCGKKSVSIKEGWNNDHTIYTNLYGVHITQEEYDNICKTYKDDIVDCDKYDLIIFVEQDDTITGLRLANDDGVFCNMEYGSDNAENAFEKVDELFRSIYSEAETHIFEGENK